MPSSLPVHTITIFPKIQADTAVAVYLLKAFGEEAFPGVQNARVAFTTTPPSQAEIDRMEAEGTLMVDLGGMFDHHRVNEARGKREESASTLIAAHLGISDHPALKMLLAWAKRDDLEGKGTVSKDPLDRAFGLSGIISTLNREYIDAPEDILDLLLPIIDAHVREQIHRKISMPQEWEDLLARGAAKIVDARQGAAELRVAYVPSDDVALPGFLRAAKDVDVVIQRRGSGHVNVITRQRRGVDLRPVAEAVRKAEAKKKDVINLASTDVWRQPGRMEGIDEWYYDTAGNTLQNGGLQTEGTPPTKLSGEEVLDLVLKALPDGRIGAANRR